jgi:hypothetical protein
MSSYFDQLSPTADRVAIAKAIREIVIDLRKTLTLTEIVDNVRRSSPSEYISENALKLFLYREVGKRINARNSIISALYDYIVIHFDGLPEPSRTTAIKYLQIIDPAGAFLRATDRMHTSLLQSAAMIVRNWLLVEEKDIRDLAPHLSGKFILLRKSSVFPEYVLKSVLQLELNSEKGIIEGSHIFIDLMGHERTSQGFFLPVKDNLYGIFSVERKQAMELFGFSIPIQSAKGIQKMTGFSMSVDMQRTILSARTLIESENPNWTDIPNRFSVKEPFILENSYVMERVRYLDQDTALSAVI